MYPKRRSDLNVRVVENETVVFDRQGGLIHQLNETAGYIWERCDGKSTVRDITSRLARAFGVEPATARKDCSTIVSQLKELNLINLIEVKPRRNS